MKVCTQCASPTNKPERVNGNIVCQECAGKFKGEYKMKTYQIEYFGVTEMLNGVLTANNAKEAYNNYKLLYPNKHISRVFEYVADGTYIDVTKETH